MKHLKMEQFYIINPFSGEIRYPDECPEPTLEEAKEAFEIAKKIKKNISKKIDMEQENRNT